ncbi:MAG TPA: energy transducer TonB [Longimicrobium sp.]|jgi:TonB family protein|nr:energy transducer TonB [Longimicrobium sp.]
MKHAKLRLVLPALLAAAPALAAQAVPRGPHLLRVAASGDVVLSLDSAAIARTGDSTFVVDAVYQHGGGSDRQVESQAMDCARARFRGRRTMVFSGDVPLPVTEPEGPVGWLPVDDEELPIFQAICGYLLGSFAASIPVTLEAVAAEEPPELANRFDVAQALSNAYPRMLRDAGTGGTVLMRVQISADGRADLATARVLWATRPEFADAVTYVVRRMRFRPAKVGGRAVAAWTTFPVLFSLVNEQGLPPPPGPQRTPSRGPTIQPPARP